MCSRTLKKMTYNKQKNFRQKDNEEKKGKKAYRLRKQIQEEIEKEIKQYESKH